MIVEIVTFDLPPSTNRVAAVDLYRQSAGRWLTNPDLIEKYYFFDETRLLGGGVYFWPSNEAAKRWHGDDYRQMIRSLYGSEPRIQIFDALVHVVPDEGISVEL